MKCALLFWATLAHSILAFSQAESFKYQTLSGEGLTDWTISVPDKSKDSKTTEINFDSLEIKKTASKKLENNSKLKKSKLIGLVGDTGCRLKESTLTSSYQDCSDPEKWPYPQVIAKLNSEKPDLIIHVGDYHYREQCSPGKPCQKMSPSVGYDWAPWKLDFFEPSQEALKTTPWIMVRGNHEDCKRAFLGYKKLLAHPAWKEDCIDFEEPQVIDLGDLAIVNLDSSSISDFPEISPENIKLWKARINSVDEKLKNLKAKHLWVVTHKPIYGLVKLGKAYAPTNINFRKYFEESSWASKVELILSGHVHNSQLASGQDTALQIVLGNGGTTLEDDNPPLLDSNLKAIGYQRGKVLEKRFGYMLIRLEDTGKRSLEFRQKNGDKLFACHLDDKAKDCF